MEIEFQIDNALLECGSFLIHWSSCTTDARLNGLWDEINSFSAKCAHESCELQLSRIECYKDNLHGFGRNPNRYRISSDALFRRCKRDGHIPSIHPIVDANNILSLSTGWPVGCYDPLAIEGGSVVHRLGMQGEQMETLGKGLFDIGGLPVLSDGHGPFGSTISDSVRTRIREHSTGGHFVLYGFGDPDFGALSAEIGRVMTLAGFAMSSGPVLVS